MSSSYAMGDGKRPTRYSKRDVQRMVLLLTEESWTLEEVSDLYGVDIEWLGRKLQDYTDRE